MAYIKRTCSIEGCEGIHCARGLCKKHYYAALRVDALPAAWEPSQKEDLSTRFWRNVTRSSEEACWPWQGTLSTEGYGIIGRIYAHRASFEIANGEPAGEAPIDHICHNRACVNPAHLRRVTHKQNLENLAGANRNSRSGVRGVWQESRSGRWLVQVTHNGRRYSGGSHATLEDAEGAAIALRNKMFTHNEADRVAA